MTEILTIKQQKLLDIIKNNIEKPLNFKQMALAINVKSTSVIAHHLKQLVKKGFLIHHGNDYLLSNPNDNIVTKGVSEDFKIYLNLTNFKDGSSIKIEKDGIIKEIIYFSKENMFFEKNSLLDLVKCNLK